MPQIYSRNYIDQPRPRRSSITIPPTPPTRSSPSPPLLGVTDVDEAIVLSDLVRTGEASRLRRRGAMRFDHNAHSRSVSGSSTAHPPPYPYSLLSQPSVPSSGVVLVERSNWDSDEEIDTPMTFSNHRMGMGRRHPARSSRRYGPYSTASSSAAATQPESKDEYLYALVCGAEVMTVDDDSEVEAFKPSVLPLYPPSSSSSSSSRRNGKRNTGCGAIVHLHAAPRAKFRMWTARSAASETVVPLEAYYFDTKEAARFMKSSCGCVKEGVGCAVCGNPLGMRFTPCKSASEGLLCTRQPDKHPYSTIYPNPYASPSSSPTSPFPFPVSSSYNLTSSRSSQKHKQHHIYTFLADSVSSTPSYTFPPPKPPRASLSRRSSASSLIGGGIVEPEYEVYLSPVSPPSPRFTDMLRPPFVEDEEEENHDPYSYGYALGNGVATGGWRSVPGGGGSVTPVSVSASAPPAAFGSTAVAEPAIYASPLGLHVPVPLTPTLTSPLENDPQAGMILDRFIPSSPVPLVREVSEPREWGQTLPIGTEPEPEAQPLPPVQHEQNPQPEFRTRTGRTATRRWSSASAVDDFPSLSSGLGGGGEGTSGGYTLRDPTPLEPTIHEPESEIEEEPVSFYQQQILTAWERERDRELERDRETGREAGMRYVRSRERIGSYIEREMDRERERDAERLFDMWLVGSETGSAAGSRSRATAAATTTTAGEASRVESAEPSPVDLNLNPNPTNTLGLTPILVSSSSSSSSSSSGTASPRRAPARRVDPDPDGEYISWDEPGDASHWGFGGVRSDGLEVQEMDVHDDEEEDKPEGYGLGFGLGFIDR